MRCFLILLIATLLAACSPKIIPSRTETQIHYERITDTLITHVTDSALIAAFLECDSLGRVHIRDLQTENGKLVTLNALLKDNLLKVNAKALTQTRNRETIRGDTIKIEVKVPVPYEVVKQKTVYKLKWHNRILVYLGLFYLGKTALKLAINWKSLTIKTIFKTILL